MNLGAGFVQNFDDIQIPVKFFLVVKSTDDVNFGRTVGAGFQNAFTQHVITEDIGLFGLEISAKRAEPTAVYADIRRVQMDFRIIVSVVPVFPLPNQVGEPSQRQQIRLFVEEDSLVRRDPFPVQDFLFDP